ncbi:hypothetical protein OQA88_7657 [Cercophora sp. LCS_1]
MSTMTSQGTRTTKGDTSADKDEATPKPPNPAVKQNVTRRYLKRESLQELLESLFSETGQRDFDIKQKEDQWVFTAPRKVED